MPCLSCEKIPVQSTYSAYLPLVITRVATFKFSFHLWFTRSLSYAYARFLWKFLFLSSKQLFYCWFLLHVRLSSLDTPANACSQWRTQEFCSGGGGSTNSVEDRGQRERVSGGGSPLVRGSGGSCNMVQEISFHIVKFSWFWYFKTVYDDNQLICHCKYKTIANLGSFRILRPFCRTSWGVGVLNSALLKLIRMLE